MYSFEKYLSCLSILNQVFLLMLSFMSSLYILDVNLVSDIFVNFFSHSMVCLFGFGFSGGSDSKETACNAGD